MREFNENNDTSSNDTNDYQQKQDDACTNEINLENMSDEEIIEEYESTRAHDTALGDQYIKYDEQIGQISRDQAYFPEEEWNSYMNEKIEAQNDVSTRRYQIQSEMRAIEAEMDRRRK